MNNAIPTHDPQKQGEHTNGLKNGHGPKSDAASDAAAKKRLADSADKKSELKGEVEAVADCAADSLKTAAERAKEVLGKAEQGAQGVIKDLKERMAPVDAWVRTTTTEHPYLVVGAAVGVSFMAGFMVRRRAAVTAGVAVGFLAGCLISGQSIAMAKKVASEVK